MFKKAQKKLFLIITSILVAIFIAVLGSINILTQTVMQRQSRNVLQDIAAGVEYDDETSTFVLMHFRNDFVPRRDDRAFNGGSNGNEPPPIPEEVRTTQTTVVSSTGTNTSSYTVTTITTVSDIAEEEITDENQESPEEPEEVQEVEEVYEDDEQPVMNEQTEEPKNNEQQAENNQSAAEENRNTVYPTESPLKQDDDDDDNDDNDDNDDDDDEKDDDDDKRREEWREREENRQPEDPQNPPNENNGPRNNNPDGRNEQGGSRQPGGMMRTSYSAEDISINIMALANESAVPQTTAAQTTVTESVTLTTAKKTKPASETQEPPAENQQNPQNQQGQFGQQNQANTKNGEPVPKTLGSIDFFVIMADTEGNYAATLNNEDIDETTAQSYINAILNEKDETGMLNSYQYYQAEKNNGTLMVFTDKSDEIKVLKQLTRTTIIIGAIALALLSAAAYFLSKKSLEPLQAAFEKQKRFISDASHELKTPLTVISANADVLSGEIGQNKWLEYIKAQTDRMNVLVNDLLNLTRLENNTVDFIKTDFNLSQAITNTALPFECQAFETNKKFIVDIEDGLTVNGSEQHIKQLAAIFIDNALKYSNDGGMVRVKLRSQGDKKVLSIYNTGQGVKESEKDKIFERFYRSDDSRSRMTGGYGLGLAIAKSIIDKHKFKIDVENEEGKSICFLITM